jgi:hypothetical protein
MILTATHRAVRAVPAAVAAADIRAVLVDLVAVAVVEKPVQGVPAAL